MRPLSSASLVPLIAVTLFAFNYVVSIGFGGSWGLRPLVASAVLLLSAAGIAFLWSGNPNGPILGVPLILWLGYFYAHLGISFILAALIATPGCEMRAIPEMLGRLTGRTSDEHQCPAAFITRIDAWEQRLRRQP